MLSLISLLALLVLAAWLLGRRDDTWKTQVESSTWVQLPERSYPHQRLEPREALLFGEDAIPGLNHTIDNIKVASRLL